MREVTRRARLVCVIGALLAASPASADAPYSCGGFAMLGGAQLVCSHTDPGAPAQICNFSWTLMNASNVPTVVEGSFLLAPGVSNATVYQGSGFTYGLSSPVVLCQGRKSGP